MNENRKNRIKRYLNAIRNGMRHLFLHNGWLKIIAVVISLVLWAGLISQDESITRDKTFQDVNVSVTGAEALKNNALIVVSDLEQILGKVTVVAAVPQKQYENAEASAYNIRLDLSRIKGTGPQEVKLLHTNSSTYGKVTSITPSAVTVDVEDYSIRERIPVSVTVNGEIPEGWYMSTPSVDPQLISVSGPRSVIQTILRAKAFIDTDDIDWTEGTAITSSAIQLYNRAGEEVDSSLVSMKSSSLTIDSVLIELNILPSKTFEISNMIGITGTVAKGYQIKDVRVSPESITVAAREEVLEQLADLPLERTTVNVKNLNETTKFQIKVQKPSEDAVISNDTVTVTVEIEAPES